MRFASRKFRVVIELIKLNKLIKLIKLNKLIKFTF